MTIIIQRLTLIVHCRILILDKILHLFSTLVEVSASTFGLHSRKTIVKKLRTKFKFHKDLELSNKVAHCNTKKEKKMEQSNNFYTEYLTRHLL